MATKKKAPAQKPATQKAPAQKSQPEAPAATTEQTDPQQSQPAATESNQDQQPQAPAATADKAEQQDQQQDQGADNDTTGDTDEPSATGNGHAEAVPALRIQAKTPGFCRGGRKWSAEPTLVLANEFTEEQITQILSEPELIVELVGIEGEE